MIIKNKKAETRIQHIIIAVLLTSLFGISLFAITTDFITEHSNGTITEEDLVSDEGEEGNNSHFYSTIENLNNMTSELTGMSQYAPGGELSASSSEDADSEGSVIKAGYTFISKILGWVWKFPKAIIEGTLSFFGLPGEFASVATTILLIIVVIILVSSILKNRI